MEGTVTTNTDNKLENRHAFTMYEQCFKEVEANNFSPKIETNEAGHILVPVINGKEKDDNGANETRHISKLPIELVKVTRTPTFKKWFGDWINDPENASKVVQEDSGEPMVVFHGVESQYDPLLGPNTSDFSDLKNISGNQYFTSYKLDAKAWSLVFAKMKIDIVEIFPAFLNIKQPIFCNSHKELLNIFDFIPNLKSTNDGVIQRFGDISFPPPILINYSGQRIKGIQTFHETHSDQLVIFKDEQRMYIPFNLIEDTSIKQINI